MFCISTMGPDRSIQNWMEDQLKLGMMMEYSTVSKAALKPNSKMMKQLLYLSWQLGGISKIGFWILFLAGQQHV